MDLVCPLIRSAYWTVLLRVDLPVLEDLEAEELLFFFSAKPLILSGYSFAGHVCHSGWKLRQNLYGRWDDSMDERFSFPF